MAIIFRTGEEVRIRAAYAKLPEPRPSLGDYMTFVYDNKGIDKVLAMDPQHVVKAAVGAEERHDMKKHAPWKQKLMRKQLAERPPPGGW